MKASIVRPKATKPQEAYLALHEQICDGRLPPGMHLTLRPLAKSLGMSVASVSEALRALAHEGLVESEPHYGARVRKFDLGTLLEQHVFRIAIECEAARRCAARASGRQLDELGRVARRVDRLWDVEGKVIEGRRRDIEFHLAVARLAAVGSLTKALEALPLFLLMEVDDAGAGREPVPNRTHAELVRALRTHDPQAAEQAMRAHCEYSMSLHLRVGPAASR
jgi:DNA-binding GntR family transcriptional regulator